MGGGIKLRLKRAILHGSPKMYSPSSICYSSSDHSGNVHSRQEHKAVIYSIGQKILDIDCEGIQKGVSVSRRLKQITISEGDHSNKEYSNIQLTIDLCINKT